MLYPPRARLIISCMYKTLIVPSLEPGCVFAGHTHCGLGLALCGLLDPKSAMMIMIIIITTIMIVVMMMMKMTLMMIVMMNQAVNYTGSSLTDSVSQSVCVDLCCLSCVLLCR